MQGGAKGTEAPSPDEKEVEMNFWLSWVINKKTKKRQQADNFTVIYKPVQQPKRNKDKKKQTCCPMYF